MKLKCFIPQTIRDPKTGEVHYTGDNTPAGYVVKSDEGMYDVDHRPISLDSLAEIKTAIRFLILVEGEDLRFRIVRD